MKKTLFLLISFFLLQFSIIEAQKTIGIFTFANQGTCYWDPESISSGISGSEEAVIYMSQKLAKLGYQVTVFGNPPENSPHSKASANPRYVPTGSLISAKLDIAIAWRMPDVAKELKTIASSVYLWPHDVQNNNLIPLTAEQINEFTDVLWLSKWQQKQWASTNPAFEKFTKIFGNGINPEQFKTVEERKNPYSCIYASNYSRGLDKLLDIWPSIKEKFPQATLDIYYGWNHWGTLSPEQESQLRKKVDDLKQFDVKENGIVGHEELNRAFERSSFWTYPCTAEETFCITAIRAQLAGAIPVIFQHSGLTETAKHGFACFKIDDYLSTLTKAMEQVNSISIGTRKKMGEFILENFTWECLALKWDKLFNPPKSTKQTICLNMVTLNNSATIEKILQSIKSKIDFWVILDSGSTDGTQEIIKKVLNEIPGELLKSTTSNPKNEALFLAKDKADYSLLLTPNDDLQFADDFSFPDLEKDYYYSLFKEKRELLINNKLNWNWSNHLTCSEAKTSQFLPGIITTLNPTLLSAKKLSSQQEEKIKKQFNAFYLAQTYLTAKDYVRSLKMHEDVNDNCDEIFPIYPSLYYTGVLRELLNKDSDQIIDAYSQSYRNNPTKAEPLFRMSAYFYAKKNFVLGYALARQATSLQNPHDSIYNEDWVYDYGALFSLGNCAYSLGKYEEAEDAYKKILSKPNLPSSVEKETLENLQKTQQALFNIPKAI